MSKQPTYIFNPELTVAENAKVNNCHHKTMSRWLKQNNISYDKKLSYKKKCKPIPDIVYDQKLSRQQNAVNNGCTINDIARFRKQNHITGWKTKEPSKRLLTDAQKIYLWKLLETKYSKYIWSMAGRIKYHYHNEITWTITESIKLWTFIIVQQKWDGVCDLDQFIFKTIYKAYNKVRLEIGGINA